MILDLKNKEIEIKKEKISIPEIVINTATDIDYLTEENLNETHRFLNEKKIKTDRIQWY